MIDGRRMAVVLPANDAERMLRQSRGGFPANRAGSRPCRGGLECSRPFTPASEAWLGQRSAA